MVEYSRCLTLGQLATAVPSGFKPDLPLVEREALWVMRSVRLSQLSRIDRVLLVLDEAD